MARATTGIAYFTLGLVLLGSLVFLVFVILPAWSSLGSTRDRLAQRITERDQRKEFLANVDARSRELSAYESHARALSVAFPESKAPADLSAIIHAVSARNGVVVESVAETERRVRATPTPAPAPDGETPGEATSSRSALTGSSGIPRATRAAQEYEYTVSALGTYAQIRAFIGDLERSLRLFDVPSLALTGGQVEGGGVVTAQITLITRVVQP